MNGKKNIRVLLVDDHDLVLQGLKRIVEHSLPEIKSVCTASSGREVQTLVETQKFDLLLLDIELPDMSGMDLISFIRDRQPEARIIINTMHEEIWFIRNLLEYDVDGIVFKSIDSHRIVEAVRKVLGGGKYFCTYVEQVRKQMLHTEDNRKQMLTLRELEVLKCISDGMSTQEIAQALCVSTNTVDTHRRHLMEKMGTRNVADLIMTAVSKGIIPIRKC